MRKTLALAVLALPLAIAGCSHPQPVVYAAPPPPPAFTEIAQRGFHDGFDAARRDIAKGLAAECRSASAIPQPTRASASL